MDIKRLLKFAALVLFIAAGIGFATLSVGTVTLSLIGFGLACMVASEL
jgi:hypothetical protein